MKKFLELSVHPFAAAGLFLLLFASPQEYRFAVLSSVFLHELGHTVAALLLHKRIKGIKVMPTGINIALSVPSSYAEEFCIAAAGPLMNFLYAFAAVLLPYGTDAAVRQLSLLLGILNLLPLAPLDGGRMLSALIAPLFGAETARTVSALCSLLLLSLLWMLSLYIFFYSGVNFTGGEKDWLRHRFADRRGVDRLV